VVATDVTYLQRLHLPNLEVRQHDILADPLDVLGPGSFDMVCWRLFNVVLARWRARVTDSPNGGVFAAGGWLVDQDGDWGTVTPVDPAHPFYARYHEATAE